eukprot:CAMPEP_0198284210 /NCGR_PEP_ID=MMETSP1449-20131203/3700_1 /TAXON_ID=420275 /ORGANISM="Attheya septentrionalis, Strain CCMP2084" /LENGTH=1014 /DNA_ID=CAMNT_0043981167 /DNA_START=59 /DNA_END=3100 /DNA_ORIENTATION=-
MSFFRSCRHGPRHWFRIAPPSQKYGVALLAALSLIYVLSTQTTHAPRHSPATDILENQRVPKGNAPAGHVPQKLPARDGSDAIKDGLTEQEWADVHRLVESSAASLRSTEATTASSSLPRFLLIWPTIPVTFKGSDSRALDAISFLTHAGYSVDLMFWHDYADEIHSTYDDTSDRERILTAGVHQILGPNRLEDAATDYYAVVTWVWPDMGYLQFLKKAANHIKRTNGLTYFIPVVDDVGVTPRFLLSICKNSTWTIHDTIEYVVAKRPRVLLGKETVDTRFKTPEMFFPASKEIIERRLVEAETFLRIEMYLFTLADVTVGINSQAVEYLKRMVPGVPSKQLSYVSPVHPSSSTEGKSFSSRSGYLFFGYNNYANNAGMEWFEQEVLPHVATGETLHLAGTLVVPTLCACSKYVKNDCHPLYQNVVCHGPLSDEELDALIRSVKVAINPVLEPSGVATKTCRAMASGTPVVVSDMDGTFDSTRSSIAAIRCPRGDSKCIANGINEFLMDERKWTAASTAAPGFITKYFGRKRYMHDWTEILEDLASKQIEVLIEGDSSKFGESMTAQNWNIAHMLAQNDQFHVTVMGKLTPSIEGVNVVETTTVDSSSQPLDVDELSSYPAFETMVASPFYTGFQVNIVIRQSWPFTLPQLPLKFCGAGCRVGQILPWEFGSLPVHWMNDINIGLDWLWGPSEYTRLMYEKSGFDPTHTSVLSAGVDCDKLLSTTHHDENNSTHPSKSDQYEKPVTFFFTGGLLPRKGVDIILDAWEKTFCSNGKSTSFGQDGDKPNVRLFIHTSYELGYSEKQIAEMNRILKRCDGSVEWKRKEWVDDEIHSDWIRAADIYIAPFRSEGFGLPIVESLVLGKSAIIPLGGSPADDYGMTAISTKHRTKDGRKENHPGIEKLYHHGIYPLHVEQTQCTQYPCQGKQLCVFEPCKNMKCTCRDLVSVPSWLKIDPSDVGAQMEAAYRDIIKHRIHVGQGSAASEDTLITEHTKDGTADKGIMGFCFSSLGPTYW